TDQRFLKPLQPSTNRSIPHRRSDSHYSSADNPWVQLECRLNVRTGQFPDPGHQFRALALIQLPRCDDFCLADPEPLLHLAAPCECNLVNLADAIVVNQHRQQVAQLALQPHLRVQLVQNRDLLHSRDRRVDKQFAQFPAAVPGRQKIGELTVQCCRIQLCRSYDISECASVTCCKCRGHQPLPPPFIPSRPASLTNCTIKARSVSGVSTSCLAA